MKLNIRARTLLIVLLPQCLLAMLLGIYFIQLQLDEIDRDLQVLGERSVRYLASGSEFLMLSGNFAELNDRLNSALEEEDLFKSLLIIGPDGSVIAATGPEPDRELAMGCWLNAANCRGDHRRVFTTPVNFSRIMVTENPEFLALAKPADETRALGTALLALSSEPMVELQKNLIAESLLILLVAVLISAFVALSFARGLSLPILQLSRVWQEYKGVTCLPGLILWLPESCEILKLVLMTWPNEFRKRTFNCVQKLRRPPGNCPVPLRTSNSAILNWRKHGKSPKVRAGRKTCFWHG